MSNPVSRPPLPGIIRHHGRVVGSLQLPPDADAFLEQFNRQYEPLGLQAERAEPSAPSEWEEGEPEHRSAGEYPRKDGSP